MGSRKNKTNTKKRACRGNQFVKVLNYEQRSRGKVVNTAIIVDDDDAVSANRGTKRMLAEEKQTTSSKKIKLDDSIHDTDNEDYFVLINFGLLQKALSAMLMCPDCEKSTVKLSDCDDKKMGLCHKFLFKCTSSPVNGSSLFHIYC